jgi:hypothetical protein
MGLTYLRRIQAEPDRPRCPVAQFDVQPADFYGTGHGNFDRNVALMVKGTWQVQDGDAPDAYSQTLHS